MDKTKPEHWIDRLELEEHPEGGYYRETYRKGIEFNGRSLATNIFYLLPSDRVSKFHRLQCDEIWYYHYGSPLNFYFFTSDNEFKQYTLGLDLDRGEQLSLLVPAKTIFGAEVQNPDSFTLVSCNMSPGFHFEDFEMFEEKDLVEQFPKQKSIIRKLT
ncbi:MAG: cupin domain-containing protein [Bacteroidales bacterium]